jgi:Galactose oxidase, central domain
VGHTATILESSVLVAGGWPGEGAPPTDTAELYDPGRNEFVPVGEMSSRRGGATATRLPDGRVLLVGGTDGNRVLATADLYDLRTRRFVPTGAMRAAREAHTAVALRDGRVLVVGGRSAGGGVLATAEIYDPRTGRFTPAGRLRMARQKHAAVALRDGSVLVVGGSDARDFYGRRATAEIFDAARGRTRKLVRMREARYKLLDAVVRLSSGNVLVAGGGSAVELYDVRASRFRAGGRIGTNRYSSTATLLRDGGVFIAGGYDDRIAVTRDVWRYRG